MNIMCDYMDLILVKNLEPHPSNPNIHSSEQIELLANLINKHGFRHPIIVSRLSGYVVAGHGRLEAARLLDLEKVPVDFQDFKDQKSEYEFMISDNSISDWSHLDAEVIQNYMDSNDLDLDIDSLALKDLDIKPIEIIEVGAPDIQEGSKEHQSMTFSVHQSQADLIKHAVKKCAEIYPESKDSDCNDNRNGNVISFICEKFLNG